MTHNATPGVFRLELREISIPLPFVSQRHDDNLNKLISLSPRNLKPSPPSPSSAADSINPSQPNYHTITVQLTTSNNDIPIQRTHTNIRQVGKTHVAFCPANFDVYEIPMMYLPASLKSSMPSVQVRITLDSTILAGVIYISPSKLSSSFTTSSTTTKQLMASTTNARAHTHTHTNGSNDSPVGVGECTYSLRFDPKPLFDYSLIPETGVSTKDELKQITCKVFVVAGSEINPPPNSTQPKVQVRIKRMGRMQKNWPWQITNRASTTNSNSSEICCWNNAFDFTNISFHVARRSFVEVVVIDENENSPFAKALIPISSLLDGSGSWIDLKPFKLSQSQNYGVSNVSTKYKDTLEESEENKTAGSIWLAASVTFDEVTTVAVDSDDEEIEKIPSATMALASPPIQNQNQTQILPYDDVEGTLYVLVHEAIDLPPKNTRVGLQCSVKTKTGQKKFTNPCILGKKGTHPIWGEHLEVKYTKTFMHEQKVKQIPDAGEPVTIQIIDARNKNAARRLVGFATLPSIELSSGIEQTHLIDLELIDSFASPRNDISNVFDEPPDTPAISKKLKKLAQVKTATIKISTLFVPEAVVNIDCTTDHATAIATFKLKGLNRTTLVDKMSFLAEEPILPPPPLITNFKDSPEALTFAQYAATPDSSFLTRSEFLKFCNDKFKLDDTAAFLEQMDLSDFETLSIERNVANDTNAAVEYSNDPSDENYVHRPLSGIMEVLNKNEAVRSICGLFVAEFKANGMFDVSFSSFIKFLRLNGATESNAQGVELASEVMALERASANMSAVGQQVRDETSTSEASQSATKNRLMI